MAGRMVHIEISADDTEKARSFCGGLFGWEFAAFPPGSEYHISIGESSTASSAHPDAIGVERRSPGPELPASNPFAATLRCCRLWGRDLSRPPANRLAQFCGEAKARVALSYPNGSTVRTPAKRRKP